MYPLLEFEGATSQSKTLTAILLDGASVAETVEDAVIIQGGGACQV